MTPDHLHLHIDLHPDEHGRVSRQLDEILTLMNKQGVDIMADVASVKQLIVDLGAETDALSTKIDAEVAEIASLKAQIAAGSPVTQADLDAISAGLSPISDRLKALGASPADPIPAPVTTPVEVPPAPPATAS